MMCDHSLFPRLTVCLLLQQYTILALSKKSFALRLSSSSAASKREFDLSIFNQCISLHYNKILDVGGNDCRPHSTLFHTGYTSESEFNKAFFNHISPRLQKSRIRPECCICSGGNLTELTVKTIVPKCSIADSKIDVALMSAGGKLLLGMIGLKNNISSSSWESAQFRTVSCSLCALAYSSWGVLRRRGPLVSLLVAPTGIYRFTFKKPEERDFGLDMKVEKATEPAIMEWVLDKYISDFIQDYDYVEQENLEQLLFNHAGPIQRINPLDWTSINLKNVTPLGGDPNLGFLFTTTCEGVNKLDRFTKIPQIPSPQPDMPAIIKCLSAVLDTNYGESEFSLKNLLQKLLTLTETQNKLDERRKKLEEKRKRLEETQKRKKETKKRLATEQALLAAYREIARLQQERVSKVGGSQGKAGQMESEATVPVVVDSGPDPEPDVDPEPEPEEVEEIEEIGIKHPYLGWGTLFNHPYFVMRDMGTTLHDLVAGQAGQGEDFCARWRGSPVWRAAFLEDVGLTALNLVAKCGVCHNDIRPPNIAFRDGRFCLLDFDMSRDHPQFQKDSAFSPKMTAAMTWLNAPALLMCYSVAQIAVNVFILDSGGTNAGRARLAVRSCIWSAERDGSAVDAAFERWAEERGALVLDFVAGVREACLPFKLDAVMRFRPLTDFKGYFTRVLSDMLA